MMAIHRLAKGVRFASVAIFVPATVALHFLPGIALAQEGMSL
jgi:hypothetical protein